MLNTKYKYLPQDFAVYFTVEDFTHRQQNRIMRHMFENHNSEILFSYRSNFFKFKSAVSDLLIKLDSDEDVLTEAELIMKEVGNSQATVGNDEPYFIGAYFKLIKLQLMYSDKPYKKVKLRTLLHDFGYKRRTEALTENISNALKALNLYACLKNFSPCNIRSARLDDMIMIRLIGD